MKKFNACNTKRQGNMTIFLDGYEWTIESTITRPYGTFYFIKRSEGKKIIIREIDEETLRLTIR